MNPVSTNAKPVPRSFSIDISLKFRWALSAIDKDTYSRLFKTYQTDDFVTFSKIKEITKEMSEIDIQSLFKLCDISNDNKLDLSEFLLFMFLVNAKIKKSITELPTTIPDSLLQSVLPPTTSVTPQTDFRSLLKKTVVPTASSSGNGSTMPPPSPSMLRKRTNNNGNMSNSSDIHKTLPIKDDDTIKHEEVTISKLEDELKKEERELLLAELEREEKYIEDELNRIAQIEKTIQPHNPVIDIKSIPLRQSDDVLVEESPPPYDL